MEETTKYYTPEIEEFHVGFEYEALDPVCNIWVKFIVNAEFEDENPLWFPSVNKTRVKYLDKEDIESLGFKQHRIIDNYYEYLKAIHSTAIMAKSFDISILQDVNNPIKITIFDITVSNKPLFTGKIKNKSELKVLLKQLGIL